MSPTPPVEEGKALGWLNAVKGLTLTNALVIILLLVALVPAYVVYKALGDDKLLDRLMSTYEEMSSQHSGCTVRHVQERGGPDLWGISSGFAAQGADRWFVNVVLSHEPGTDEIMSYCESLKLIADRMLERGGGAEIHGRPVPGAQTNGSGYYRPVPADPVQEETGQ
jgi:hypothetical protein